MLKRAALLLMIFFCQISAQEGMNEMRIIGKPELLQREFISNDIRDANGDICAGLKIITDLTGFSYLSNNGIVKIDAKPGRDVLFLSPGERVVEVFCTGYKPLKIYLYDVGIKLNSRQVWQVKISGDKEPERLPVNIIVKPPEAEIFINNELQKGAPPFRITPGRHYLRIEKEYFSPIIDTITVTTESTLFNYTLEPLKQIAAIFKSKPKGAFIFVNNFNKGRTDKGVFLFPGTYDVKISLEGYQDETGIIEVKPTGTNEFKFNLKKNSGSLILNITKEGVKIFIDQDDYSGCTTIDLFPGKHKVEVSAEGHRSYQEIVDIKIGETITRNINLIARTGGLQLSIQPLEADVKLVRDYSVIDQWKGLKIVENLIVGKYTIEAECPGYEKFNKTIVIKENHITTEDIILRKVSGKKAVRGVNMENMVFVKGGAFDIGNIVSNNDNKQEMITWLDDFYIGKYEVSFREYIEFLNSETGAGGKKYIAKEYINFEDDESSIALDGDAFFFKNSCYAENENCPAAGVTLYGARAYCEWAGGRLPDEAEWEFAAKGGLLSKSFKFSGSNFIDEVAWHSGNSGNKTQPAGMKKPNELGLFDMSGNVWEWCEKLFNGKNRISGAEGKLNDDSEKSEGILYGGSSYNIEDNCVVNYRISREPEDNYVFHGFRLVRDPD